MSSAVLLSILYTAAIVLRIWPLLPLFEGTAESGFGGVHAIITMQSAIGEQIHSASLPDCAATRLYLEVHCDLWYHLVLQHLNRRGC